LNLNRLGTGTGPDRFPRFPGRFPPVRLTLPGTPPSHHSRALWSACSGGGLPHLPPTVGALLPFMARHHRRLPVAAARGHCRGCLLQRWRAAAASASRDPCIGAPVVAATSRARRHLKSLGERCTSSPVAECASTGS
jgi:hypothetical protein